MPRKNWNSLYQDWPKLLNQSPEARNAYVDAILDHSVDQDVAYIRHHYTRGRGREVDFRCRDSITELGQSILGDEDQQIRYSTRMTYVPLISRSKLSRQNFSTSGFVLGQKRDAEEAGFPEEYASEEELGDTRSIPCSAGKSSSGSFTILGELILSRPPSELEQRAEQLEPYLEELDNRNMKELDCPIKNLHAAFQKFKEDEISTWKTIQHMDVLPEALSPDFLVKPSGSLSSPIAHHLNQPTFTTGKENIREGEVADPMNGCTSMVMGNLYETGETLMFDHIALRIQCKLKIEVVWGVKVQQRLVKTKEFEVLPLWGEFKDVVIMLSKESNYGNADPRYRFRRIILCLAHPGYMYWQKKDDSETSARQDRALKAAALMARKIDIWKRNYFLDKLWFKSVPGKARLMELKAYANALEKERHIPKPTILQVDNNMPPTTLRPSAATGDWDIFFNSTPHSNQAFRELIPEALGALEKCTSDWQSPSDLPEPVLRWFQGQKEILFYNIPVSSFNDVTRKLETIVPSTRFGQGPSEGLGELLIRLMGAKLTSFARDAEVPLAQIISLGGRSQCLVAISLAPDDARARARTALESV
ncbi:hypothetical protein UA08_07958 [Talaromyces atroroseus]|uniref:Uncharacterized protein n=1 Tax=Talaromyces atroroseus TaxID=1441469 RepID=A0A225A8L0_TALAT|nr:hypothetical protein UA08_07958 [Talaromyces atroroseus]OKL56982.1 hypothetical protein UA08_07958 [Talaromyces atroroseus]